MSPLVSNTFIVIGFLIILGFTIYGGVKTNRGETKLGKGDMLIINIATLCGILAFSIGMFLKDTLSEFQSLIFLTAAIGISIFYSLMVIGMIEARLRLATD